MLQVIHATANMEDATSVGTIDEWSPENIEQGLFKPMLLYLRELRGKDVTDIASKEEIDDIHLLNNLYFQLTREQNRGLKFFENGMSLEFANPKLGPILVFLTSGELYYMDGFYDKAAEKAKSKLDKPLAEGDNDSMLDKAKNSVSEARKKVVIDKLILNLEKAMGIKETFDENRYSVKPVDKELNDYDRQQIEDMVDRKYHSR